MKNIVMVSSSPRKGGNSDLLAREFKRGAEESGNRVIEIFIRDIQLNFCKGCLYCQSHDGCAIHDGMQPLYFAVSHADVLVFATPVYYYGMSGQLKTFLESLTPIYGI